MYFVKVIARSEHWVRGDGTIFGFTRKSTDGSIINAGLYVLDDTITSQFFGYSVESSFPLLDIREALAGAQAEDKLDSEC